MVPIYQYEAKKGMGGSGDMPKPRVKPDHDLCLVGLGGHGALGNA